MNKYVERLSNGVFWENPTFVLMLGMCPTLAVTTSAVYGIGMGLSTLVVLTCSNLLISLFRKVIPNGVRMPIYIVIVASLVTVVQFLMEAYLPSLATALGVYIPLIVVNCIILGRAESYASKNPPLLAAFDGLGMGLGFTIALTLIGLIREILGAGTIFNIPVLTNIGYTPMTIFIMAPGAFLVLAVLVAVMNIVREKMKAKGTPLTEPAGCLAGTCATCGYASACGKNKNLTEEVSAAEESSTAESGAAVSGVAAESGAAVSGVAAETSDSAKSGAAAVSGVSAKTSAEAESDKATDKEASEQNVKGGSEA